MIDLLLFLPACFSLNLAFGPNNLLALTHGVQNGVAFALSAGMARLAVFVPMIAASALGFGVLLSASELLFGAIKIAGAIYLIWMGAKLLRTSPVQSGVGGRHLKPTFRRAFRREAMVAVGNPKAILIFAAFFPQFVDTSAYWQSYASLGGIFLSLEICAIALYASVGRFLATFASTRLHWFQRLSGAGMILFGVLLLFSRQPGRS